MCLISFAWQPHTDCPLIMVANRDEFHRRAALPAHFWEEHPHMLAGKDLEAGGSWLGISRSGRFAALTNYRQIPAPYQGQLSRGMLVSAYLQGETSPENYLQQVAANAALYDGFNLIVGDLNQCWYFSNRSNAAPSELASGVYGLSNHLLNTPWPKVRLARENLIQRLRQSDISLASLAGCLDSTRPAPREELPDTGIGPAWEHMLSAARIISPEYGTRANTRLMLGRGRIRFREDSYNPAGLVTGSELFSFDISNP